MTNERLKSYVDRLDLWIRAFTMPRLVVSVPGSNTRGGENFKVFIQIRRISNDIGMDISLNC